MSKKTWTMTLSMLVYASALHAHHSQSMFDAAPVWETGTVVRYEPVQPHAMIVLEQRGDGGQIRQLTVEGPNLNRLERLHLDRDFLKAGDVIAICGFAFREEVLARRSPSPAPGVTRPDLHAQMLVLPDGKLQSWGPYGKFDNCVRPDDRTDTWLDFLNRDPLARDSWCNSQTQVNLVSTTPKAFRDEINRRLDRPCNQAGRAVLSAEALDPL